MKKSILFTMVLSILLISCDLINLELNPDITFLGSAEHFKYDYEYPALDGRRIIEQSIFKAEEKLVCIYTDLRNNGSTYLAESTNSRNFTTKNYIEIENSTFFYADYVNSEYYIAYGNRGNNGIFLIKSSDGFTWEKLNNGNPIIRTSPDINSIWYYIWNPCFVIDENNIMHLYIECAPQCVNQSEVGLGYAEIDLNDLSVNLHDSHILKGGGNPWIKKIDNEYLIVTGMLVGGFWRIESFKTSDFYNLSKLDFSISEKNMHICDPSLTETADGRLLISYSYYQRFTFFNYADIEYRDILSGE